MLRCGFVEALHYLAGRAAATHVRACFILRRGTERVHDVVHRQVRPPLSALGSWLCIYLDSDSPNRTTTYKKWLA